jgi:hypothetical protein
MQDKISNYTNSYERTPLPIDERLSILSSSITYLSIQKYIFAKANLDNYDGLIDLKSICRMWEVL